MKRLWHSEFCKIFKNTFFYRTPLVAVSETKAIQTNLGTFSLIWDIQELLKHIQAYLEPCVTLIYLKLWCIQNPDIFRTRSIFRTPAYSQPFYIQNPAIFRTLAYSKYEAYTEPCYTSTLQLTNYSYFRKACCVEINILR